MVSSSSLKLLYILAWLKPDYMFIAFLHTNMLDKWVFYPRLTEDERLEQNVHILVWL